MVSDPKQDAAGNTVVPTSPPAIAQKDGKIARVHNFLPGGSYSVLRPLAIQNSLFVLFHALYREGGFKC